MKNEFAVITENLIKTLSGIEVIKGCNINVRQGDIYGLLGANGAGKTTVFKILTGLLTPTIGKVEVLGKDIGTNKVEILRNIGSLIEVPIFYEHLSATENLKIHLAYMDVEGDDISKTLEMIGLENVGSKPVSKFSLGMRQRLGIARAIIHKPKLLILDEPINGLDPLGILKMRELFLSLVQNNEMTILISSHILSEIEHIADTVGIIINGVVVEETAISKVKKHFKNGLEEYYLDIMLRGKRNV